jgi:hypothetical protein
VVVLAHRRSRLGTIWNPTVNVATSVGDVLSLARGARDRLGERQRAEIERLIRRDHDFHHRHRR